MKVGVNTVRAAKVVVIAYYMGVSPFGAAVAVDGEGGAGSQFCWELSVMCFSGGSCEILTQPSRRWHKFGPGLARLPLFGCASNGVHRTYYGYDTRLFRGDALLPHVSFAIRASPLCLC